MNPPGDESEAMLSAFFDGRQASTEQVKEWETAFEKDPRDLRSLAVYFGSHCVSRKGRLEEPLLHARVLWLVQHRPDSALAWAVAGIYRPEDPKRVAELAEAWTETITAHPSDSATLANAAHFFILAGEKRLYGRELLERAHTLSPGNAEAARFLASITLDESMIRKPRQGLRFWKPDEWSVDERTANKAVAILEGALESTPAHPWKEILETDLLKAAAAARDWTKVRARATEMIQNAATSDPAFAGDFEYYGNWALGRAALYAGEREEAKRHLLASGRTQGSPVLGSFGPDMTLAKELLLAGERETVLEFLLACERFWKSGKDVLMKLRNLIASGKFPSWWPNLSP